MLRAFISRRSSLSLWGILLIIFFSFITVKGAERLDIPRFPGYNVFNFKGVLLAAETEASPNPGT
jgi:hypothetical protein